MYFTSFDLSIMFSTCFYYRYNFVRNGTPYILARSRAWQFQVAVSLNIWCIPLIFENVGQIGRTGKTYMMTDFFVKAQATTTTMEQKNKTKATG